MIIQSQIQITIQMANLLQAGRANPTHHAPAPPSLANTCRFSYMQGGPSQHASPRPPSLAHTCIFSYMQGGPVQHASPPLPLPPAGIRVFFLKWRVGGGLGRGTRVGESWHWCFVPPSQTPKDGIGGIPKMGSGVYQRWIGGEPKKDAPTAAKHSRRG